MKACVSFYNGVKDTEGYQVSIDYVMQRITSGVKGLDKKTRDLNKWVHEKPVKYKERKIGTACGDVERKIPKGTTQARSTFRAFWLCGA